MRSADVILVVYLMRQAITVDLSIKLLFEHLAISWKTKQVHYWNSKEF